MNHLCGLQIDGLNWKEINSKKNKHEFQKKQQT